VLESFGFVLEDEDWVTEKTRCCSDPRSFDVIGYTLEPVKLFLLLCILFLDRN
jgi:hypothetical protein